MIEVDHSCTSHYHQLCLQLSALQGGAKLASRQACTGDTTSASSENRRRFKGRAAHLDTSEDAVHIYVEHFLHLFILYF